MPIVQFAPFSSLVQPTLWHELTRLKLEVLRLSDDSVPLTATYSTGRTIKDRNTGQDVTLGCNVSLGGNAFNHVHSLPSYTVSVAGMLKNYNTIEDFKNADKHALFNQTANEVWESIISQRDTSALTHFLVITFSDLKKYKYYYWFAFPALVAKPAWEISSDWTSTQEAFSEAQLLSIYDQLAANTRAFFLVRPSQSGDGVDIAPVEEYALFFANVPAESKTIAFIDPSPHPSNPGWPLRNLLACLRAWHPTSTSTVRVLCWRDSERPHEGTQWRSRFGVLSAGPTETTGKPSAVGWEKNVQGKLG
ncbi:hypothetical protein EW146_g5529, partial [Bondarzewia mesenterica]